MNRICAAVLILAAFCATGLAAPRADVAKDWDDQYARIAARIKTVRGGKKQVPASQVLDRNILILPTDRTPLDVALRRARALVGRLGKMDGAGDLSVAAKRLGVIASQAPATADAREKELYIEVRTLTRAAALGNPLLDFDSIVFIERRCVGGTNWDGYHMATASFGHTQRSGGGLYVVRNFKSDRPEVVNVLAGATVGRGKLKGRSLAGGAFLSPDLSYDGREIMFSWAPGVKIEGKSRPKRKWQYTEDNSLHVFKVGVDPTTGRARGDSLVQLTDGNWNDFDACFLPGGRVAFMSTRTTERGLGRIYPRCFAGTAPEQFFLHSMAADGSDIIPLSYHETDEWQPSVNNDGMIVYTRWDYVDRNSNAAQHIWTTYPDGRDPRAPHGNYVHPFSTVEGKNFGPGVFTTRPCTEWHIRAVPKGAGYSGSSKYVACAGPHHGEPFGALVLIDTSIPDDGLMSQVKRLTPNWFPESETNSKKSWDYGTPWPLSTEFYIANYLDGLYVVDRYGNKDLICKTSNTDLRPYEPMPLRARTRPPVIPTQTYQGKRLTGDAPNATIRVMNAYVTDLPFPKGTQLKELRIVQYFPKSTEPLFTPRIGIAEQSLARMVLGTVPVESDGSINFEAPVAKGISFQLIDQNGMAVQAMRSITYVHNGEQMACVGCHESKWAAPQTTPNPIAMRRAPSKIAPEVGGLEPMNFHRLVKPVLDAKCTPCHAKEKAPPDMSYKSLKPYLFYLVGGKPTSGHWLTIPKHGGSRSMPGKHGAYGAALMKYLDTSHFKTKLTKDDRRRITMWLDCNSNELGAYRDVEAQRRGELVWPVFDVDPTNPLGVEKR